MYQLKTKSGDLIYTATADNLNQAIELFAKFKNLSKEVFLNLFTVSNVPKISLLIIPLFLN